MLGGAGGEVKHGNLPSLSSVREGNQFSSRFPALGNLIAANDPTGGLGAAFGFPQSRTFPHDTVDDPTDRRHLFRVERELVHELVSIKAREKQSMRDETEVLLGKAYGSSPATLRLIVDEQRSKWRGLDSLLDAMIVAFIQMPPKYFMSQEECQHRRYVAESLLVRVQNCQQEVPSYRISVYSDCFDVVEAKDKVQMLAQWGTESASRNNTRYKMADGQVDFSELLADAESERKKLAKGIAKEQQRLEEVYTAERKINPPTQGRVDEWSNLHEDLVQDKLGGAIVAAEIEMQDKENGRVGSLLAAAKEAATEFRMADKAGDADWAGAAALRAAAMLAMALDAAKANSTGVGSAGSLRAASLLLEALDEAIKLSQTIPAPSQYSKLEPYSKPLYPEAGVGTGRLFVALMAISIEAEVAAWSPEKREWILPSRMDAEGTEAELVLANRSSSHGIVVPKSPHTSMAKAPTSPNLVKPLQRFAEPPAPSSAGAHSTGEDLTLGSRSPMQGTHPRIIVPESPETQVRGAPTTLSPPAGGIALDTRAAVQGSWVAPVVGKHIAQRLKYAAETAVLASISAGASPSKLADVAAKAAADAALLDGGTAAEAGTAAADVIAALGGKTVFDAPLAAGAAAAQVAQASGLTAIGVVQAATQAAEARGGSLSDVAVTAGLAAGRAAMVASGWLPDAPPKQGAIVTTMSRGTHEDVVRVVGLLAGEVGIAVGQTPAEAASNAAEAVKSQGGTYWQGDISQAAAEAAAIVAAARGFDTHLAAKEAAAAVRRPPHVVPTQVHSSLERDVANPPTVLPGFRGKPQVESAVVKRDENPLPHKTVAPVYLEQHLRREEQENAVVNDLLNENNRRRQLLIAARAFEEQDRLLLAKSRSKAQAWRLATASPTGAMDKDRDTLFARWMKSCLEVIALDCGKATNRLNHRYKEILKQSTNISQESQLMHEFKVGVRDIKSYASRLQAMLKGDRPVGSLDVKASYNTFVFGEALGSIPHAVPQDDFMDKVVPMSTQAQQRTLDAARLAFEERKRQLADAEEVARAAEELNRRWLARIGEKHKDRTRQQQLLLNIGGEFSSSLRHELAEAKRAEEAMKILSAKAAMEQSVNTHIVHQLGHLSRTDAMALQSVEDQRMVPVRLRIPGVKRTHIPDLGSFQAVLEGRLRGALDLDETELRVKVTPR